MTSASREKTAATYMETLCTHLLDRRVGSPGNRAATDLVSRILSGFGFETCSQPFDCIDWCSDGVRLVAGADRFEAFVSPYSLGGYVHAPLKVASTVEALEDAELAGALLLLEGDLAKEPLMPKSFPFYNPEEHQRIVRALETKEPAAIIAATSRHPDMAGAVYPFPLIEDGDFDIPSVYMTEEEGARLAAHADEPVSLDIRAMRRAAEGWNVIGTKGDNVHSKVVFFAHVDSKAGSPGALDNASGVVVLLLLAELLADYAGELLVEIVALNGEDYYSNPGEQAYLAGSAGAFGDIVLGVNLDGVGYRHGGTAYSLYHCPSETGELIERTFAPHAGLIEGEPWYQGDHMLFLMNEVPAVAITSEQVKHILSHIVHTPEDSPDTVDVSKLARTALALQDLVLQLDRSV